MKDLSNEEELVRVSVYRGAYRTTVSMDLFLSEILTQIIAPTTLQQWVQTTLDKLERDWQYQSAGMKIGQRVRAKSGISRLLQREALRHVLNTQHINFKENNQIERDHSTHV